MSCCGSPIRRTRFWGDESWKDAAYTSAPGLFGSIDEKAGNEPFARAFGDRLKRAAGFKYVAEPLAMRNSTNAVVYYLVFASQNATAHKIINAIFKKWRPQAGGA
jgi:three-Cys-motif partner protein